MAPHHSLPFLARRRCFPLDILAAPTAVTVSKVAGSYPFQGKPDPTRGAFKLDWSIDDFSVRFCEHTKVATLEGYQMKS
jgi:hypothetical protein